MDLTAVVHEVEDEGVLLERVDAVQPRERLHRLDAGETLVHVQRVQQRLVEARLVLLGDQEHLVVVRRELLRQLRLPDAGVHRLLRVGHLTQLVVLHRAGEGDERPDRVTLLPDVAVEALLEPHRLQPRAGHHHRLGPAADAVPRHRVEVLHHHLGLLRYVVRMEVQEAGQRPRGRLALDVRIAGGLLEQLEVGVVRRIVPQHVEDEPFLSR